MSIKALVGLLSSLGTFALALPSAEAVDYYPAETKYWVDCSTGFRNNDGIESVEFSDPASERRDANGFLDYSSIVWKKATLSLNPKFTYKALPPESAWNREEFDIPCVGSPPMYNDGHHHAVGIEKMVGPLIPFPIDQHGELW
jgi:hypothetical protein